MTVTNILLIDPSRLFRSGLRQVLPPDMRIVAEASDATDALRCLERQAPDEPIDMVLLEVAREEDVQSDVQALKLALPDVRIVHLTEWPTAERLSAVFTAGADGCLSKDRSGDTLGQALRLVAMGEKVFPSDLMSLMRKTSRPDLSQARQGGMSVRETQILQALLQGQSNKVIAQHLLITEATVKVHLKSLMRKLNVSNRTQAAIWAMNRGMTSGQAPLAAAG